MATAIKDLENSINNTVELSSVCRGEWCRKLESEVDYLEDEVTSLSHDPSVPEGVIESLEGKLRSAYRQLGPDIHL